jgi:hypothetical protein
MRELLDGTLSHAVQEGADAAADILLGEEKFFVALQDCMRAAARAYEGEQELYVKAVSRALSGAMRLGTPVRVPIEAWSEKLYGSDALKFLEG